MLLVLLVVSNLAWVAVLVLVVRRTQRPDEMPDGAEVFSAPRPAGVTGHPRRLISIEILNPLEVAGARGRVMGIAGSLAPGLVRRVVYDLTLKTLRQQLLANHVVADVRLHTLRPVPAGTAPIAVPRVAPNAPARPVIDLNVVDDVAPIDLSGPPPD